MKIRLIKVYLLCTLSYKTFGLHQHLHIGGHTHQTYTHLFKYPHIHTYTQLYIHHTTHTCNTHIHTCIHTPYIHIHPTHTLHIHAPYIHTHHIPHTQTNTTYTLCTMHTYTFHNTYHTHTNTPTHLSDTHKQNTLEFKKDHS